MKTPTIAVCAVQGAFIEHERRMSALGCDVVELRQAADLNRPFDALILPGGESTAQSKMLRELGMFDTLRERIAGGLPVLGTCAGLILLAQDIAGANDTAGLNCDLAAQRVEVRGFKTLPVTVVRNAYGRQLGSFRAIAAFGAEADAGKTVRPRIPMTFIRAPYVAECGEGVEVLARVDERVVGVRWQNQLGLAFHPELDEDDTVFRMLLGMIG